MDKVSNDKRPPDAAASNWADRPHQGGDPLVNGDAQYGASPLRPARYEDIHDANADIKAEKTRSGHNGAQARYPKPDDAAKGPTGHDERQQSRDLARDSR